MVYLRDQRHGRREGTRAEGHAANYVCPRTFYRLTSSATDRTSLRGPICSFELQPTVLLDGPVAELPRPAQQHVGPRQVLTMPPHQQPHMQVTQQTQAQVPFRRNGPELLYPAGLEFSRPQPHHQGRPW